MLLLISYFHNLHTVCKTGIVANKTRENEHCSKLGIHIHFSVPKAQGQTHVRVCVTVTKRTLSPCWKNSEFY